MIKKVKNTMSLLYVISHFKGEDIVRTFSKKELRKAKQKEFRIEKVIKQKSVNYMLNGKAMISILIARLIKKACVNERIFFQNRNHQGLV